MHAQHWALLALLADGRPHHVRTLAQQLGQKPPQLNMAWQKMPAHIRGLLRQHEGHWHLVRPLAVLPQTVIERHAAAHGFQAALRPQCASSNNEILVLAKHSATAAHRRVCVTYEQSAGRGRQGRQWVSRAGECLMLSLGWAFDLPQTRLSGLALTVALAVCRSLHDVGVAAQIKWPNDLVLGADKLGGILIETVRQQNQTVAVIGIGLNFVLPKTVAAATAVQTVAAHACAEDLYARLLYHLTAMLPEFNRHGFAPFQAAYEAAHRDQNQNVHLLQHQQPVNTGTVLGVTATGALRLLSATGEQHIVSGEISLRPVSATVTATAATTSPCCLLLDGGNSKLKWAWVQNGRIGRSGKAAYTDLQALARDWHQHGSQTHRIVGAAVCGADKQARVAQQLPRPVEWLASMPQALGIRNHYRQTTEHGADRWFNILGSRRHSRHACLVVSCGTAVTLDALTDDNQYLGGSIMPGFHLMKEAMAQHTAHLDRPVGKVYAFATTTPNALASGMTDAVCGAVVLMHERLRQKVGIDKPVDVIITGGAAVRVVQALPPQFGLDNRVEIVDNLVIHGLLNWVEHA